MVAATAGVRVGVASLIQETNTFSPLPMDFDSFEARGWYEGEEIRSHLAGTATEVAGAIEVLDAAGVTAVPLLRGWAYSGGRITHACLETLSHRLSAAIAAAGPLDGMVLSLHGAMAADGTDDADRVIAEVARIAVGADIPLVVCLDLHANVTHRLVEVADAVIGYRTYPHIDIAETGGRAAAIVLARVSEGRRPVTRIAKRPMLLPAETTQTTEGPMCWLRQVADEAAADPRVMDISLFPVQPWLDVRELGYAVAVTTDGDPDLAADMAELLADVAWEARTKFDLPLVRPAEAISLARESTVRPFLLSESADSPGAGTPADSPAMVGALLEYAADLRSYVTLVDAPAVAACFELGLGGEYSGPVGSTIDQRFHTPVHIGGRVDHLGDRPVIMTGGSYTGVEAPMGRYAVVTRGRLSVLLTEKPALTVDSASYRHVCLDPDDADVIVVRSANQFKAGYPAASGAAAVILDLPGASTPRLQNLEFHVAPRPMWPLDQ